MGTLPFCACLYSYIYVPTLHYGVINITSEVFVIGDSSCDHKKVSTVESKRTDQFAWYFIVVNFRNFVLNFRYRLSSIVWLIIYFQCLFCRKHFGGSPRIRRLVFIYIVFFPLHSLSSPFFSLFHIKYIYSFVSNNLIFRYN